MKHIVLVFSIFLGIGTVSQSSLFAQASSGKRPQLLFYRHNSSPLGAAPVMQGDTVASILFTGLTQVNPHTATPGANIRSVITGPVSAGVMPSNLLFATSSAAGIANRMVITDAGLVGIGTMNPQYNLQVSGNTHTTGNFYGRIHFDKNQTSNDAPNTYTDEAYFELKSRSLLGVPAGIGNDGGVLSLAPGATSNDHQLFFANDGIFHRHTNGQAASWAGATWYKLLTGEDINGTVNYVSKFTAPNRLGDSQLFDNGTNVGIGTNAPAAKLDINGTLRTVGVANFDGAVNVNGALTANNAVNVNGALSANNGSTLNGGTVMNANAVGSALQVSGTAQMAGRVAIGTSGTPAFATGYALSVQGKIITDEVMVQLTSNWPDYVFAPDYQLPDLCETEEFIKANHHLPGIPSAAAVAATGGVELGELNRLMLQKIEELTLIVIDQQKQLEALKNGTKQ